MPVPLVLDLPLPLHLLLVMAAHLLAVVVAVPMVPVLLQPLLYLLSALLDERGVVQSRLEVGLLSEEAVGRDYLIPRGLSVLCPFPEEVGLVYPPFCYSGLAIVARQARRRYLRCVSCVSTCPHRSTYSSCARSWALRGCYAFWADGVS